MEQNEVILGVDTHLDTHVGALISDIGKLLGTLSVTTDTAGYLNHADMGELVRPVTPRRR
ncbi:hypothetical protein P0D84_34875 [Paraburkholderia sp. RL17-337-BIB-A]|uniref:hypothetical protein n=1 Tax=Paraburkholderia sp. RL17-337-BIB-A TaxID=3031636 RepID=UPI0038BDE2CE